MTNETLRLVLVYAGTAIFALTILIVVIKNLKSYEYEKKFSDFSLLSNKDIEISFFDRLITMLWNIIYFLSGIVEVSAVLKKSAKKYSDDIDLHKKIKDSSNYIAIKILCSFSLAMIFMFCSLLQYVSFAVPKLLLIIIIGYIFPNFVINYLREKRTNRMKEDLLKAVIIMNNSFKSGRSIIQAIETVQKELDGPISAEFQKITLDISYGLNIDVVFERFANRVKLEDAKYIATSLTLLNKTGGNIIKVFSMIERSFFEKKNLDNELKSLTSASVFLFRFLSILPFAFAILISVLNPGYFKPFVDSTLGIIIFMLILVLYASYIYLIRKVLKVEM